MNPLIKANRELDQEVQKQIDLIYGSAGVAFARWWGWGSLRIQRLFDKTMETWDECGRTNDISMIQMLEEESGIELRIPDTDKGWRDLAYLNAKIDVGRMSKAQMVYMRQRQKKWVGAQLMACLFLALHRKYGFGKDRLTRLMGEINKVEEEFDLDRKKITDACRSEAGINLQQTFGEKGAKDGNMV